MNVEIPDQIINQTGLSIEEILLEAAISLFQDEKITLGQASKLAGLHQIEFQKELAKRNIPVHYGEEEYQADLKTLALLK
jgi:predicted HTH domain antitoxin